ncbi:4'-phosphopantetheinyl transferase superfamily protein [Salmonella enterica subsp. houtenae]|uniref:Enterobactin synthase component D n=1 Tax=Salmonella houtenae TaxID=59205 RepID=A0A5Y2S908_SALHO|nr:4'-phosphopantetheinyl transferase superfamily protein [Salmonella enterica]ECF6073009.1 4'-phosphopantetheinyl transferase superfamily protein [Salmonella enterica subsp. houtenae]EDQ3688197.1 4'-phosphopantetheinyl transferase superfamily protein [Salmonella enterica subsp. enterica serovar Bonariensis]EDT6887794.1 4'-phosphopantetheinyl transferase superfamily protein [Salmonella enterica subsp. enterica]EDX8483688.1 4'-phosphopantetheinyl transferase superfamily protein [Salmonella enter
MFTFEKHIPLSAFIRQQSMGVVTHQPEVSVCLVAFDSSCYRDTLFTQLSIPFPDILKSAVTKRRAEYLAGRYAASQLLQEAGCNDAVTMGADRAPVWPVGWWGSISHTEKWAIAILGPHRFNTRLGIDIEMLRPDVMLEIANTFTIASERNVLATNHLPYETALLIAFSAKESLFKALYPQAQNFFGFEAAKLCELRPYPNRFTLELTRQLAPDLHASYRIHGYYLMGETDVTTMIV